MKRILFILLALAGTCVAQNGAFYTDRALGVNPFSSTNTAGSTPSPIFISYGQVRVCTLPTTGSPCNTPATISDIFGNNLPIVGGNFGQITTDVVGRFSFGCSPGNYEIQVAASLSNTPQLQYPVTCPANTGIFTTNNIWTGTNTFNNQVTINALLTLPLLTPNSLVCTDAFSDLSTSCGTFTLGTINGQTLNLGGAVNVNAGAPAHSVTINEGNNVLQNGVILNADNVLVGKASVDPVADALPSCSDAAGQHLNYTLGTGFSCGTTTSVPPSFNPPTRVVLGSAVGLTGTPPTQATVLSTSFTFPAANGTYRLLVSYNMWLTVGANLCAAEVIDFTNTRVFAASGQNTNGTGYIGISATELSTQTYAPSSTITVHLDAECNNAAGGLVGATVNMNSGAVFTMSPAEPTYLSVSAVLSN